MIGTGTGLGLTRIQDSMGNISGNPDINNFLLLENGENMLLENNDAPIFDSLFLKSSGNPGQDTPQKIMFSPVFTGNRNVRVFINSTQVLNSTTITAGLLNFQEFIYFISLANWNTIYSGSPTLLQVRWEYEVTPGVWSIFYRYSISA